MSLFETPGYRWRETYLVFFKEQHRPLADAAKKAITDLGSRFEVREVKESSAGKLASLTLLIRGETSAMDIVYTGGEEATEQIPDIVADLQESDDEARASIDGILHANARLDVLHFQLVSTNRDGDDEDEGADPTSLLRVLERLCQLCHGIAIDPQSATLVASA